MAKEVLQISPNKIVVDYKSRNDSDDDVTTEVAFPVPSYKNGYPDGSLLPKQRFDSFMLYIDGKPARYQIEAKATFKGRDVTSVLAADHIDIATFGHFDDQSEKSPDLDRLNPVELKKLLNLGLATIEDSLPSATWTVHLQYHWSQTFTAHTAVHIRHEYSPVIGFEMMLRTTFEHALLPEATRIHLKLQSYDRSDLQQLSSFCPDESLLHSTVNRLRGGDGDASYAIPQWVDFILTTANTWQRPIEDFTLIVERTKLDNEFQPVISFCSPGPVEKIDANHFQVHMTNFVPKAELHIGFFGLPAAKTAKSKQKK